MSSKTYIVAEGVEVINANRVPSNRRVRLTDAEASYDLALGRIQPARRPKTAAKNEPQE